MPMCALGDARLFRAFYVNEYILTESNEIMKASTNALTGKETILKKK